MAIKLSYGDRVIIEIRTSEIFEGTVEYVAAQSIELSNIYCQTTNTQYDGNMIFYRNEVVALSRISDSPEAENPGSVEGDVFNKPKKINMHPDEFGRLKTMTLNFIFIDTFGKVFNDAVDVLINRESVAVVGLGSTFTRGKPLSLLLMADFKQVFIFDIFCLVQLKQLKEVLESDFICKVVHDGAALFDCLYHKYGVEMRNVFDTKIVDTIISKEDGKDVKRNLSECLVHYFNFPPSLLSAAMDDLLDKTWVERPIIKSNKIKASQLVTYLLSLRDLLITQILQHYTDAIQSEYNKYKCMNDTELLTRNIVSNT